MKKKKVNITILSIIVLLIIVTAVTIALFTDTKEEGANLSIGDIEVILREDWDPDDVPDPGIERNTKETWGESTGENDAYVRMRFIPVVEYYYEADEEGGNHVAEWRTAPISQENIQVRIEDPDNKWVKQGSYYYYKPILKPSELTTRLNLTWQIIEIPSTIAGYQLRTDVRAMLEYSQTSNGMWKEIFKIDSLPEGVEKDSTDIEDEESENEGQESEETGEEVPGNQEDEGENPENSGTETEEETEPENPENGESGN